MTAVPKIQDLRRYKTAAADNSWNHEVAAGEHRVMAIRFAGRNVNPVAPIYDGTALQLASGTEQSVSSGTNRRTVAWYTMKNPPVGVHTLSVAASGDTSNCTLHVYNLVDCDLDTLFRAQGGNDGVSASATTGTTSTLTPASEVGDLVLDGVSCRRSPTEDSGQKVIGGGIFTTGFERTSRKDAEATSTSVGWTFASSDPWAHAAIVIRGDATTQPEQADYEGARGKGTLNVQSLVSGEVISAGATVYISLSPSVESGGNSTLNRTRVRDPGTFAAPVIYVNANATSAATTVALQEDGTDTGVTITVGAGVTGRVVGSGSVAVDGSTSVGWRITAGTGGDLTIGSLALSYEPDGDDTLTFFGVHSSSSSKLAPGTSGNNVPSGTRGSNATESAAQLLVPIECEWGNLYVVQTGTTTNGDTTFRSRKNGANGNQVIVYGSGEGGLKEDATNVDTLTDGDLINLRHQQDGSTGDFELERFASTIRNETGEFLLICGAAATGGGFNVTSGTVYLSVAGEMAITTTEAVAQVPIPFDMAVKRMLVFVGQHTSNGDATVTLRRNGSDTALTRYIMPRAQELWYEDIEHVVELDAGDLINLRIDHSGSTNNLRIRAVVLVGVERVAGASTPVLHLDGSTLTYGIPAPTDRVLSLTPAGALHAAVSIPAGNRPLALDAGGNWQAGPPA